MRQAKTEVWKPQGEGVIQSDGNTRRKPYSFIPSFIHMVTSWPEVIRALVVDGLEKWEANSSGGKGTAGMIALPPAQMLSVG